MEQDQEMALFERARIFLVQARLRQELGIEAKLCAVREDVKEKKEEAVSGSEDKPVSIDPHAGAAEASSGTG